MRSIRRPFVRARRTLDRDTVSAWLTEAVATLHERAEAISDAAMRTSFLEGVPEHARIRALAGAG